MGRTWKSRVRLEVLLAFLGAGLVLLSRLNRGFRERLGERDGIVEMRTEDRSVARRFYLSRGRLRTARGCHPSPDYAIVYRDAADAVEILGKGSQEAAMQAVSEGRMRFEGDLEFGMWFNELLQYAGETLKEPRRIFSRS